VDTHRRKEDDDPNDVGNLSWIRINSHNDIEEEIARKQEVEIHEEMPAVASHQRPICRGEVEAKE
jgi:hypothetical protein